LARHHPQSQLAVRQHVPRLLRIAVVDFRAITALEIRVGEAETLLVDLESGAVEVLRRILRAIADTRRSVVRVAIRDDADGSYAHVREQSTGARLRIEQSALHT